MKKKFISTMLAALTLIQVSPVLANESNFKDVNESDWYYPTVKSMVDNGYINGYEDNTFRPNQPISRIEFAKIVLDCLPKSENASVMKDEIKTKFRDAYNGYWATDAIIEATERGFVTRNQTIDEWSEPITRAEMAQFSYLACKSSDFDSHLAYYADMSDVIGDIGDCLASDYCVPIVIMFSSGIVSGTNDNRDYEPESNASRAEACAIINRILDDSLRADASQYTLIHPDAPLFNAFLTMGFTDNEIRKHDREAIDYSYLETTQKGDYSKGTYGYMTDKQIEETQEVVDNFLSNYIRPSMSDLRKVCIAAEYIMENCSYGSDEAESAYTAWGALVGHAAWCTGFSTAFKLLCDSMDVGCVIIPANEKSANPSHEWNAVCIDGYWYIADIQSNDLARDGVMTYGADFMFGKETDDFLVSSENYINKYGMMWDMDKYPICEYDFNEAE